MRPADDQARMFPSASAIETIVLLNDALTVAIPWGMFFFSFFAVRARLPLAGLTPFSGTALAGVGVASAMCSSYFPSPYFFVAFFLPAIVCFRGPFRVRAFVCVRWPRTGRFR